MRISDWSSDVCSSDLRTNRRGLVELGREGVLVRPRCADVLLAEDVDARGQAQGDADGQKEHVAGQPGRTADAFDHGAEGRDHRSCAPFSCGISLASCSSRASGWREEVPAPAWKWRTLPWASLDITERLRLVTM